MGEVILVPMPTRCIRCNLPFAEEEPDELEDSGVIGNKIDSTHFIICPYCNAQMWWFPEEAKWGLDEEVEGGEKKGNEI